MDEILSLLRENNLMLKAICTYINNKEDSSFDDIKNFVMDIVSNIYTNGIKNK